MFAAQITDIAQNVQEVQLNRIEKPTPSPGRVVVKIHSAAANPIDVMVMKGTAKAHFGWPLPLPFTIGYDFAGVVESVDEADTDAQFVVGDRVFGVNWGEHSHGKDDELIGGAFAEYIAIPLAKLSRITEGMSFDQAAAVALVGSTAHQILFDCAKVTAGQRVLILGGPTSVGHLAIQLAKARGAWVATTSSARNLVYVSQFGADLVVDYSAQQWEALPELRGLDAVIDTVGEKDAFARATGNGVVKADGAFVTIAPGSVFDPAGYSNMHFASLFTLYSSPAVQDELAAMLASGALKVAINEVFPFTLEGVHGIMRQVASGSSTGKNVIKF